MIDLPANVFHVKSVPHEWIFPQCQVIVHHGGAGTTAAALKAGVPTVIFPLLMDQPFWAQKVSQLGVGPSQWISLRDLTSSTLEEKIREVTTSEIKERAKELGDQLRKEEPLKKSIEIFREIYRKNRNCGIEMRWMRDEETSSCMACQTSFTLFNRRHHCRSCGAIFCLECLALMRLPNWPGDQMICRKCYDRRSIVTPELSRSE